MLKENDWADFSYPVVVCALRLPNANEVSFCCWAKGEKKMEKEEEKLEMLLCFAYVKVCQVGNKQQGDMCTGAEAKSKVAACSNAVSARRCGRLRCRR